MHVVFLGVTLRSLVDIYRRVFLSYLSLLHRREYSSQSPLSLTKFTIRDRFLAAMTTEIPTFSDVILQPVVQVYRLFGGNICVHINSKVGSMFHPNTNKPLSIYMSSYHIRYYFSLIKIQSAVFWFRTTYSFAQVRQHFDETSNFLVRVSLLTRKTLATEDKFTVVKSSYIYIIFLIFCLLQEVLKHAAKSLHC